MTYHDDIITIKLCRGELAASIGERGLIVKDWTRLIQALERELVRETSNRDDGHSGSSAVGDLLLDRLEVAGNLDNLAGTDRKSINKGHPWEFWPWSEKWFDGGGK